MPESKVILKVTVEAGDFFAKIMDTFDTMLGMVTGRPELAPDSPAINEETTEPVVDAAETTDGTDEHKQPPTAETGVELADGIPWDARIHSGAKTKYAKAPFGWKLLRGVDKSLVEQVEAELRAAMGASGPISHQPPVPDATNQQPPVPDAAAAFGAQTSASDTLPPPPTINTFGELVAAVTSNGIDPDKVAAALAKVGLVSLPLLGARPDLVPAVAADLFPAV